MKTISRDEFLTSGLPRHKFPHTGPVNLFGTMESFAAALKGHYLKDAIGNVAVFSTEAEAIRAIINKANEQ